MDDNVNPRDGAEEQGRERPPRRPTPSPLAEERTRGGMPFGRPIAIAAAVVLAAAAFLFWPHGGAETPGIGERYTVVEAGPEGVQATTSVRSGDVDIASEVTKLTPETGRRVPAVTQPAPATGGAAPTAAAASGAAAKPAASPAVAPARRTAAERAPADPISETDRPVVEPPLGDTEAQPEEPASRTTVPEHEVINLGTGAAAPAGGAESPAASRAAGPQPTAQGSWAVQAGAFGTTANAEEKMTALRAAGFSPFLKAGNTADGRMVYRVWIGWFASREQAADYAARHKPRLGDTLVQHR